MDTVLFLPILKADEERRIVYGRAAQEVPDKSGEILDYSSSRKNFEDWSRNFEKMSGGKSKGNIRRQHRKDEVVGKVIDLAFDDAQKAVDIAVKVTDDKAWNDVKEGVLNGFSIGGSYAKRWQENGLTKYTAKVSEVSLVDSPCCPTATFTMVKADGSVEERAFVKTMTAGSVSGGGALLPPSEGQKAAGNYRKEHRVVHGLRVAVESPKGSVRHGVDAGGTPWSVTMPADYGYIKRTEGADGDHVDVTLGPDPEHPVAHIIDQYDADTGDFDEHKTFLGFPSQQQAIDTYDNSFSDGRGPDRRGSVTTMSVEAFKRWLKSGNTKVPASAVGKSFEIASDDPADILAKARRVVTEYRKLEQDAAVEKSGEGSDSFGKNNPYHDELGQFTSADKAVFRRDPKGPDEYTTKSGEVIRGHKRNGPDDPNFTGAGQRKESSRTSAGSAGAAAMNVAAAFGAVAPPAGRQGGKNVAGRAAGPGLVAGNPQSVQEMRALQAHLFALRSGNAGDPEYNRAYQNATTHYVASDVARRYGPVGSREYTQAYNAVLRANTISMGGNGASGLSMRSRGGRNLLLGAGLAAGAALATSAAAPALVTAGALYGAGKLLGGAPAALQGAATWKKGLTAGISAVQGKEPPKTAEIPATDIFDMVSRARGMGLSGKLSGKTPEGHGWAFDIPKPRPERKEPKKTSAGKPSSPEEPAPSPVSNNPQDWQAAMSAMRQHARTRYAKFETAGSLAKAIRARGLVKFDPSQPRDEDGRWVDVDGNEARFVRNDGREERWLRDEDGQWSKDHTFQGWREVAPSPRESAPTGTSWGGAGQVALGVVVGGGALAAGLIGAKYLRDHPEVLENVNQRIDAYLQGLTPPQVKTVEATSELPSISPDILNGILRQEHQKRAAQAAMASSNISGTMERLLQEKW